MYLPESLHALHDWLNEYLDVEEYLLSRKERLAQKLDVQNIDGICWHLGIRARLQVIERGSVYALYPKSDR